MTDTQPKAAATSAPIGVLLLQLGTPDAPTVPAVRRYLREFLGDPRVIEAPRLFWWFNLNFNILLRRPTESAAKYRRVWSEKTGSPLRHYTERQVAALQKALPDGMLVRHVMRYGSPRASEVLPGLIRAGVERLLILPMYPQYSATTTASALDDLFKALRKERRMPALRVVPPYYAHPAYIEALATTIREEKDKLAWEPDHYVLSFHGIPLVYIQRGDPYLQHVQRTRDLLVERLGWCDGAWTQTFQSRLGRQVWLEPYTEPTLRELAKQDVKRVFVALPGFTADCLETIDEIGFEGRQAFQAAGGEELHRCHCLNDHPAWVQGMRTLVLEEAQGWVSP